MPVQYSPQQKRTLELVRDDILSTKKERTDLKAKIKVRREMYDGKLPRRQYVGRANVTVPFPYTWAQSMIPRYIAYIFGGTDPLKAYPRGADANWEYARIREALINSQMMHEADFFIRAVTFACAMCRDGLGIQKVRWDNNLQCPQIYDVQAEDFCMDKRSPLITKQTAWVAQLLGKTKDELLDGVMTKGYNPDVVEALIRTEPNTTLPDGTTVSKTRGVYPIWEWWGNADIGPEIGPDGQPVLDAQGQPIDGMRPAVCYFADREDMLLYATSSKYIDQMGQGILPYVLVPDVPDPFHVYESKSEMDQMEPLYETASDVVNQRLDNVTQSINGLFKVRKGAGIDVNKLVSSPWGVLTVRNRDDIERLDTPQVTQNAYMEVNNIVSMLKMCSGLEDILRGAPVRGVGTATEATQVMGTASLRPGFKQQLVAYLYVKRMGELFHEMDRLFLTADKAIIATGDQEAPQVIAPGDLGRGQYSLLPKNFSLIVDREARLGVLQNVLNIVGGQPEMGEAKITILKEIFGVASIQVASGFWDRLMGKQQEADQARRMAETMSLEEALMNRAGRPTGPRAQRGVAPTAGGPPAGPGGMTVTRQGG